LLLTNLNRSV